MWDRILECQIAKAFKDCNIDMETYNDWKLPKVVVDKMIENADRCNKVYLELKMSDKPT